MPRRIACSACGALGAAVNGVLEEGAYTCRPCRRAIREALRACPDCGRQASEAGRRCRACSGRSRRADPAELKRKDSFAVSDSLRFAIYERDELTCQLCGEPVALAAHYLDPRAPSLDHIVPRKFGGPHTADNLRTAHRACNVRRGAGEESSCPCPTLPAPATA